MTPAKRQLGYLLFLLLLQESASIRWSSVMSSDNALAQQTLIAMVSGPLSGQGLLLVTDDHTQRLLDLSQVVEAAGASITPVLLATQHSLLNTSRPAHHTKGYLLTALLLFYQDPTAFLLLLANNLNWNPGYLVLFCLNPHLNTTAILSQPVVQRSQFIHLSHTDNRAGLQRLFAYTSLPTQCSVQGRSLVKAPLGVWNPNKFNSRQSLFPPRFTDFGGEVLRVSMLCYDEPFLYFGENRTCIGMNIDALQMIADKLGFIFEMDSPEDIVWGLKHNGRWDGMFGQMLYEGKHFIINEMQPTLDRLSDFDFTYPYWEDSFAIMVPNPPPLPQWRNILYPFSSLIWGLLIGTTLVASSVLAFLLNRLNHIGDPVGTALKIASGLLSQAAPMLGDLQELWVRVWLVGWWLTVDIMCSMYTGNLVAVLTVPVFPPILRTAHDLAMSDIRPSMLNYGSFVPEALKASDNPTLAILGKNLYLPPDVDPNDIYAHLIGKVLGGDHAVIVTVDYLIFTQHKRNLTHLTYIMEDKLYKAHMSWFLPLHTPYTSIVSRHLINLLENGVLTQLYKRHVGMVVRERQVRGDGVLNLGHLQGAFIVLGLGLVAAILTLLLELFA